MFSLFNMFKEDNGNVSSMRITTFIIVICCMVDYMFSTFTKGQWKPSPEIITILLGSLGLKVGQKFAETKKMKEPTPRAPRAPRQPRPIVPYQVPPTGTVVMPPIIQNIPPQS